MNKRQEISGQMCQKMGKMWEIDEKNVGNEWKQWRKE